MIAVVPRAMRDGLELEQRNGRGWAMGTVSVALKGEGAALRFTGRRRDEVRLGRDRLRAWFADPANPLTGGDEAAVELTAGADGALWARLGRGGDEVRCWVPAPDVARLVAAL